MYKKIFLFALILVFAPFVFAQGSEINEKQENISQTETLQNEELAKDTTLEISIEKKAQDTKSENEENQNLNPKTGFPLITEKPFVIFDYGLTTSWVNRVINQEDYGRSNFNFQDFLVGAYISMQTKHMKPLNSMIRIAGYYPLSFTFNGVPQVSKAVLRGSADLFAGILAEFDMWDYLRITFSPGLHVYYQYSDRFNYIHLGGAMLANLELPIAKHWTIKLDGIASLDYANLGSNKNIEIYDICWQYQLDIGVRYSKKAPNKYNYLKQSIW